MQGTFNPGAMVRVKGAAPIGTIESNTEGYVSVRYDHRPGIQTFGYYPEAHLEVVRPATPEPKAPPKPDKPATKPQAKTADILGNISTPA